MAKSTQKSVSIFFEWDDKHHHAVFMDHFVARNYL